MSISKKVQSNKIPLSFKIKYTLGKVGLRINTFLCSTRMVAKWVVTVKYASQSKKLEALYHKRSLMIPLDQVQKTILDQYFLIPILDRPFIIELFTMALKAKNVTPIVVEPKIGRNKICPLCDSGLKYKKCKCSKK